MHESERVRIKACGCRYDAPTGLLTSYCDRHDPEYQNWLVVFPRENDRDYFLVAERHENGTVTFWTRNMGECGKLNPNVQTKPVTTKKERERVRLAKRGIERGIALTDVQYQLAKAANGPRPA